MKRKPFKLLAFPLVMAAPFVLAQEPARSMPTAPGAYRVQFFLTETQADKPATTHNYTLLLYSDGGNNSVEVGTRVPVKSGPDQYNYQRVGLSLNCNLVPSRPHDAPDGGLRLVVDIDVSSVTPGSAPNLPIIHSADSRVDTAVPLGQRVTVAKFGDLAANATYQLEVIAEPALPGPQSADRD